MSLKLGIHHIRRRHDLDIRSGIGTLTTPTAIRRWAIFSRCAESCSLIDIRSVYAPIRGTGGPGSNRNVLSLMGNFRSEPISQSCIRDAMATDVLAPASKMDVSGGNSSSMGLGAEKISPVTLAHSALSRKSQPISPPIIDVSRKASDGSCAGWSDINCD